MRPLLGGAFGAPYLYAVETTSTQDVLRSSDLPHGAVAVAEHQTAGRGRSGRHWDDAPSAHSASLGAPAAPGDDSFAQLSLVAGLAVAAAIEQEAGLPALVKWPNDIAGGREAAGILLEAAEARVVCGIGINVNQEERDLPLLPRLPAGRRCASAPIGCSTGRSSSPRCWLRSSGAMPPG